MCELSQVKDSRSARADTYWWREWARVTVGVTRRPAEVRSATMARERELKTIRAMIGIYCRDHHEIGNELCADCTALFDYAQARLNKCPWGENKPVCAQCTIHCYRPAMREEVRKVMRYAGPKMLLRHPVLTVGHLLRERRGSYGGAKHH